MAAEGQRQVGFVNTRAIITHPDQLDATLLHFNINPACTCIQRVFH